MKYTPTLVSILVFAGLFSASADAQAPATPPPNVTSVQATLENGTLKVSWSAVTDPGGIAYYRIYYSRVSILGNNGDYDDFEQTTSNATTYSFDTVPPGKDVYVSVLAVNSGGVESEAFQSEAHVTAVVVSSSSQSSDSSVSSEPISSSEASSKTSSVSSASQSTVPGEQLVLDSAKADSATGLTLNFSHGLSPNQEIAPLDIIVLDESGTRLDVTGVEIHDTKLVLITAAQTPDKHYIVATFGSAKDDAGQMAVTKKQIDFFGFRNGGSNNPTGDTTPPEDATNLRLVPKAKSNGLYDIFAFWNASPDSAGDLKSYEVSTGSGHQTACISGAPVGNTGPNGHTPGILPGACDTIDPYQVLVYLRGASLPATAREYKSTDVPPGMFGVNIKTKDIAGNESAGITKVIKLPQTGIGLFGIIAVSGALAGRRSARRKAQKEVE